MAEADRPFYVNPFRPENEEFLRRQLAQERILRAQPGGRTREGQTFTPELVEQELETIRRLERDDQRIRLGRGQPTPPVIEFRAGELTDSQVRRDLPFEGVENPFELARQGSSGLSVASTGSQAEEAIEGRINELEEEERLDIGGLDFNPEPEPAPVPFVKRQKPKPRTPARPEGVAPLDPAITAARERSADIERRKAPDNFDDVRDNFEAGFGTKFFGNKKGGTRDGLNPSVKTHFSFTDDEGFIGARGNFQGQDMVLLHANPDNQKILVRTKDSIGKPNQRGVEANIGFDIFEGLRQQGKIKLTPINHKLEPLQPPPSRRVEIEEEAGTSVVGAVGGAAASGGAVIGNAALGLARGATGAVIDRLPSAGDVGEAVGRGTVAAVSGLAGVVRGGLNAALAPAQPVIGEQTGGAIPAGILDDDQEV